MSLPCLVVTLPSSTARQQSVSAMMDRLGQPYEYIWGVDGARLGEPAYYSPLLDEFADYLPAHVGDITLLPREAGCFLSIIRALRRAQELDEAAALIVEDDVDFCIDDIAILEELTRIDLHYDQIKLTYTEHPLNRGIFIGQRQLLGKRLDFYFYWRGIIGTTCNIYSREGIAKLLLGLPRLGMAKPIDALISTRRYFLDFLPIFVRPALARENLANTSTIDPGQKNLDRLAGFRRKQRFWARKRRQWRHIREDLRTPLRSLWLWLRKSLFIWYCCKYLLWGRKRR